MSEKPTNTLVGHLMMEGDALSQDLQAMTQFKLTPAWKNMQPLDRQLFDAQLEIMRSYLHILSIRLARANDEAKGKLPDGATALGGSRIIRPN